MMEQDQNPKAHASDPDGTQVNLDDIPASTQKPVSRLNKILNTFRGNLPKPQPRMRFDIPPPMTFDVEQPQADSPQLAEENILHRPLWAGFMGAVGVGVALAVFFIVQTTQELLVWITAAFFIALGLDPIVRAIEKRGKPRWLGVLVAIGGILLLVGSFAGTLIPTIIDQTSQLVRSLPIWISDFINSPLVQQLDSEYHLMDRAQEEINRFVGNPEALTQVFGGIFGFGTAVFQSGFSALIIFVLTLYFLSSLPTLKNWLYRLAPASRRNRVTELGEQITSSVGTYVMGQALVAVVNAIIAFIAMSIAGVPYSVLLAFVVALLAFVPLVGAMIAGVLVSLIALTNSWQATLIFAAIYFVYLQLEAYFVSPRIMQKTVAVPGAVAVIAVIAGGSLLGVLGALMAIPVAAAVMTLLRQVWLPRQDAR